MPDRCCATCIYAYWSQSMKRSCGPYNPWPVGPVCSNHPDASGQLREVPPGGICRNYRPQPSDPTPPEGLLRRISIGRGKSVLVDAADYDWLSGYTWTIHQGGYAARREKGRLIFMHREIVQAPPGMVADHIDGNKENNSRSNLRICTRQQNTQNRGKRIGSASRFKGVYREKHSGKWHARAYRDGEHFRTRLFAEEVEAARAYDQLAVELFGEFAYLNFPEDWPPGKRAEAFAKKETIHALRLRRAEKAKRREAKRQEQAGRPKTPEQ